MVLSLDLAFQNAISGLNTAQGNIAITSQNISNAHTEGYSRKQAELSTRITAGVGNGVQIENISREVDAFLRSELRALTSDLGRDQAAVTYYDRIQSMFGSVGENNSLLGDLNKFAAELEALGNTADSAGDRFNLVAAADQLARRLRENANSVQDLRYTADRDIKQSVMTINDALREIYTLNNQIQRAATLHEPVTELEDKRDLAVQRLANEIDIEVVKRENGTIGIYTRGGITLLDHSLRQLDYDQAPRANANTVFNEIRVRAVHPVTFEPLNEGEVLVSGGTSDNVTTTIEAGRLKGLLTMRDSTLATLSAQIEEFATSLRDQINAIHNDGTGYPALNTLSGEREVTATDAVSATGIARIAVVDSNGNLVAPPLDLDFTALGAATVADIRDAINASALGTGGFITATITDNRLVLQTTNANNGIAIDEGDSAFVDGTGTKGMSHYFGLNNFFTGSSASDFAVREDILSDNSRVSSAQLSASAAVAGDTGITSGDNRVAQRMAEAMETPFDYDGVGDIAKSTYTFADYANAIISLNAVQAEHAESLANETKILVDDLSYRDSSISGVNLDEEMSNLVLYQNAYAMSARVLSAAQDMFDELLGVLR